MADAKKSNPHDEQTNASAESLRAAVRGVRGGMTQKDTEEFLEKIEGIAKGLEEQGKSEKEVAAMREEKGEPDLTKTTAELVNETIAGDKDLKGKNISSPGIPIVDPREDLGKPRIPAQESTKDRDAVEKTAKKADEDIKAVSKK